MTPTPRQTVLNMKAYVPPLEGRRQSVRLDFNENTTGFPDLYPELEPTLLTAYPEYARAVDAVAAWLGVSADRVLLTNGSDEGLFVAAFTFVEPGQDRALVSAPTFSLIPHSLRLCQAQLEEVLMHGDLDFDLDGLEAELQKGVKIAILASPDNPTGGVIPNDVLKRWLEGFPNTVFLIDEAYYEYYGETALQLGNHPNLLVSRTFSKAWGLAGLRLGVLVGHPQMVEYLKRVRSPYSVNSLAVQHLLNMLPHQERVEAQAQAVMERKRGVLDAVRAAGYSLTAGHANFFVIWAGADARSIESWMKKHGILVRDRSSLPRMAGSVRVSVGSQSEMHQFLAALSSYVEHTAIVLEGEGGTFELPGWMREKLAQRHRVFTVSPGALPQLAQEHNWHHAYYLSSSAEGLAAAREAGMTVVAVTDGKDGELAAGADHCLADLDQLCPLLMMETSTP